jgi:hypothetical protein
MPTSVTTHKTPPTASTGREKLEPQPRDLLDQQMTTRTEHQQVECSPSFPCTVNMVNL